jgi:hypothetical protein
VKLRPYFVLPLQRCTLFKSLQICWQTVMVQVSLEFFTVTYLFVGKKGYEAKKM